MTKNVWDRIDDKIEWFGDVFASPRRWSVLWRRVFLLTLPISVPLYLIACAAYLLVLFLGVMAFFAFALVVGLSAQIIFWITNMWSKDPHHD